MMTFFAQPTFHAKKGGIDKAYQKKTPGTSKVTSLQKPKNK